MPMPRQRGIPADRDEIKEQRSITLGPTAWAGLQQLADDLGYKSRSKLLEAIGRGEIELTLKTENQD
ncbi:MAG: hypothetical protein AAGF01_12570 [Cyanobacteria bacterium P01_G01_bin.38]